MSKLNSYLFAALLLIGCRFACADDGGNLDPGIFDQIENQFLTVTKTWQDTLEKNATYLFWILGLISMVWRGASLIFRSDRADISEFFAELVRFLVTFGFYLWLLTNGISIATSIIDSFIQMGSTAAGTDSITPSGIVQVAFDLWDKTFAGAKDLDLAEKLAAIIILVVTTVFISLIAVNYLILIISSWIYLYAGVFTLGFGGSNWTSDIALNYFRQIINLGLQLMTMILLVGIAKAVIGTFIDQIHALSLFNFVLLLLVAIVLWMLTNKIPSMVGSISVGSFGNGGAGTFGSGSAIAAMGLAAGTMVAAARKFESAGYEILGASKALNELTKGSSGGDFRKASAIDAVKDFRTPQDYTKPSDQTKKNNFSNFRFKPEAATAGNNAGTGQVNSDTGSLNTQNTNTDNNEVNQNNFNQSSINENNSDINTGTTGNNSGSGSGQANTGTSGNSSGSSQSNTGTTGNNSGSGSGQANTGTSGNTSGSSQSNTGTTGNNSGSRSGQANTGTTGNNSGFSQANPGTNTGTSGNNSGFSQANPGTNTGTFGNNSGFSQANPGTSGNSSNSNGQADSGSTNQPGKTKTLVNALAEVAQEFLRKRTDKFKNRVDNTFGGRVADKIQQKRNNTQQMENTDSPSGNNNFEQQNSKTVDNEIRPATEKKESNNENKN
jgi:P-type conjugative transfer protein TrbL